MGFSVELLNSVGNTTLSGDTFIDGVLTVNADQYLSGNTYISGICEIDGQLQVDATTEINGDLMVSGQFDVGSNINLDGSSALVLENLDGQSQILAGYLDSNGQSGNASYGYTGRFGINNTGTLVFGSGVLVTADFNSGSTMSDGTSGTDGAAGASGSSGINGIDGTSGTDGSSGINGIDGTSGTDGSSGVNGVDGTSGTDGAAGASGSSGINGVDGTSGSDGSSGINGLDGTSGSSGVNGMPVLTGFTTNYLLYNDSGNVVATDTSGLLYNPTNNNLSIGGSLSTVSGARSLAVGDGHTINPQGSLAVGRYQSIGSGCYNSVSIGNNNQIVQGRESALIGSYLLGSGFNQMVVGFGNVQTGSTDGTDLNSPIFIVGCGTGDADTGALTRNNGVLVRRNMNTEFGANVNVAGTLTTSTSKFNYQSALSITVGSPTFPTLAATITWLAAGNMSGNTTLLLTANNEAITDTITINLPFNLAIKGGAYDQNVLSAGAGLTNKPMFILQTNTSFTKVIFDGSTLASYGTQATENCFNLPTDDIYVEIKDALVTGFYNGIYQTSNAEIWAMEGGYNNCYNAGYQLNTTSTGAKFRSTLNDWSTSDNTYGYTGILLTSGHTIYLSSENDTSNINAGDTFINYTGTQISYTDIVIIGCIWNNIGTFRTGFDFTLKRDADIVLLNNTGDEDMKPHAKFVSIANTSGITLTTTFQTLPWTTTTSYAKKLSYSTSTQAITYLPTHKTSLVMWVSGAVTAGSQPVIMTVAIVKNGNYTGTTLGNMTIFMDQNARAFNFSTNVYLDDVLENDTYVIAGKCSTGTEPIIIQDINWLILST